jgi:glutathionyl-hydroquinone reductase
LGQLVDGTWTSEDRKPGEGGAYQRQASSFRDRIGAHGPFPAEAGRYRLYVSLACPWAHRTLIFRALKGLGDMIPVSVTHWHMGEQGWGFEDAPGVVPDPVFGARHLHEVYSQASPGFTGRVTVPVLLDTHTRRIVNNESAEIIRILNDAFDGIGATPGDYAPPDLLPEIEAVNARIYETLNNGVYRCGFARTQAAYDAAILPLFETLDWLEDRLSRQRFLCGDRITEADWRLFTTLIRFDAVYHGHFKCNLRRIADYKALMDHTRSLLHWPGVAGTVDLHHIRHHYYGSHRNLNPSGIVPAGPILDLGHPGSRGP